MANKFEFPFNAIVGADAEEKEKIKEQWHEETEEYLKMEEVKYAELEQEITQEEKDKLLKIENYVGEITGKYGAAEKLAPKVVVLQKGSVLKVTEGKFRNAMCSPYTRRILIDEVSSGVAFATTLAHEMFHLDGFASLRFSKEDNDFGLYRTGISLFSKDNNKNYFHEIEEALMAKATRIFYDEYLRKDPVFAKEIEQADIIKGWLRRLYDSMNIPMEQQDEIIESIYSFPDADGLIEKLNGNDDEKFKLGYIHGYIEAMFEDESVVFMERIEEQKKFDALVDTIWANSDEKFSNKQEIVDIFLRAHFSGRYLPLARLLEKAIGKGAFRGVANDFATKLNK